ncbi:MAG: class I tRNA ligase family protein, partial [Candidatus Eremiobacteraeota bacterium]|nr:class I tRNA ligase family protein [Candidatus Eremiobacteraeota bacterium]
DVRFAVSKCDDARKFCNKLWQATRFALQAFPELDGSPAPLPLPPLEQWTLPDRYLMDRLRSTVLQVDDALNGFSFAATATALYVFVWNELCDIYIEIAKDRAPTRAPILAHVLCASLQLLHPIMPFISEELWQRLPHEGRHIGGSGWPSGAGRLDEAARREMQLVLDFVETVRALRAVPKLPYRELRDAIVVGEPGDLEGLLERESQAVKTLARAEKVRFVRDAAARPKHVVSRRFESVEVLLEVDAAFIERERSELAMEAERNRVQIADIERKLTSSNFVAKAPPAVVEKEKARLAELQASLVKLRARSESV